ncbi:hypothetical protein HY500_00050 [Candidatus Woesearchaeota archaeon]|nr:hypothetical protein [Candidatus Woesearchaeota archaeon]
MVAILNPREEFKMRFGHEMGKAPIEVLVQGNPDCPHDRVYYLDNAFDGQAYWCRREECDRHVRMDYDPGRKIPFPPHALITTPNTEYEGFYAHRANENGIVEKVLPRDQWTPVSE